MTSFSHEKYEKLRARSLMSTRSGEVGLTHLRPFFEKLEEKWASKRISLCDHDILTAKTPTDVARGDSDAFWKEPNGGNTTNLWTEVDGRRGVIEQSLSTDRCARVSDRFETYGILGSGTYGTVYAAREKATGRHFAIKFMKAINGESHLPPGQNQRSYYMTQFPELIDQAFDRWTVTEAHVGLLVLDEPGFSQIDSVYLHPPLVALVMEQFAVIKRPEMDTLPGLTPADYTRATRKWNPNVKFHSVTGEDVMGGVHKSTMLNEVKICKVSHDLLAALMKLLDRQMTQADWSARNYLVDENCNALTIDFDRVGLSTDLKVDFSSSTTPGLTSWEVFALPEIAVHLANFPDIGWRKATEFMGMHIQLRLDRRRNQLDHFGCSIFEMIHGFAPWEHPEQLPDYEPIKDIGRASKVAMWHEMDRDEVFEEQQRRRERIINDDLQVMDIQQLDQKFNPEREYKQVSQDCVDVLRSMLSDMPADRPSLLELSSFPWFQGWWKEKNEEEFLRGTPPGLGPTTNASDAQAGAGQGAPAPVDGAPAPDPAAPGPAAPGPAAPGPAAPGPAAPGPVRRILGPAPPRGPASLVRQDTQVQPVKTATPTNVLKAPSQKTILEDWELTQTLDLLKLPHFPTSTSDTAGQAKLKIWRDLVVHLALILFDSKSLPAGDIRRLLTLESGSIAPPQNLKKAREIALQNNSAVTADLSKAYRSLTLLALSYYATQRTTLKQMPSKTRNPFANKMTDEQNMGRGALLQFLNGHNFKPTPFLELERYKLRINKEFIESQKTRRNRVLRSPENEPPATPPPPHPGIMKPFEKTLKRKGRNADPVGRELKRQETLKGRWTGYTNYIKQETKYKEGKRKTVPWTPKMNPSILHRIGLDDRAPKE